MCLAGLGFIFESELPSNISIESSLALFVGSSIEKDIVEIGDNCALNGIEYGRLSAAVVAEQQTIASNGEGFVLKVKPLD